MIRIYGAALIGVALAGLGGCATTSSLPEPPAAIDPGGTQAREDLEKAIATLEECARSRDMMTRANVMEAVQSLRDPRAVAILEAGLRDKGAPGDDDPSVVRFAAAMTAGKRMETTVLPDLRQAFATEKNGNVKVAMVYAMRRMGDRTQMNVLMDTLGSPDADVRANTVMVLGLLGERSAMQVLKADRTEPDTRVRYEIMAALARLGDQEAVNAIISMALSKVMEDEWNALQLCGDLPQDIATSTLQIGLRPDRGMENGTMMENRRRTLIAARGLGKKGVDLGNDSKRWVMQFLTMPDPMLRGMAALALGDIFKPGQESVLMPLLSDPEPEVRVSAAAGIVNMLARR
jgi:HEAT repeat protein